MRSGCCSSQAWRRRGDVTFDRDSALPWLLGVARLVLRIGNIRLSGIAAPVTVHCDQGTISATGLAASRATLPTDLGTIDVLFRVPPALVTASSQDGSVMIRLPAGTSYNVAASTRLGRTEVSVLRSASSAHVIRATSQLGSVTVTG
jgi:hypothetical protein